MDISVYISELLELRGDVNVPALGYLLQGRVSGYYNEAEGKFYPPHNEVQFEPSLLDDNAALTQHIADKKNISLASALYFIEKYVNALKEEARQHDVAIANIGWFYYEGDKLSFRPAKRSSNDAAFYGYEPIKATKLVEEPVAKPTPAPAPEPVPVYRSVPEATPDPVYEAEDTIYDEPRTNTSRGWIIAICVLILLVCVLLGLYKYNPSIFDKIRGTGISKDTTISIAPHVSDTLKVDTMSMSSDSTTFSSTDTSNTVKNVKTTTTVSTKLVPATASANANQAASVKVPPGGYIAIIVRESFTLADANNVIAKYKAKGIDAFIASTTGGHYKISVGKYNTVNEAEHEMEKLIASGKINEDAYPIQIKR